MTYVPLLVTAIVLAGCAPLGSFLDGRVYSLERGIALPMKIEVTRGVGQISASDPETGERFQGTYVAIQDSKQASILGGTLTPQGQFVPTVATASSGGGLASTMATMIGDKGTVLDCRMLIQPGWRPRGAGTCIDNRGGRYNLQF